MVSQYVMQGQFYHTLNSCLIIKYIIYYSTICSIIKTNILNEWYHLIHTIYPQPSSILTNDDVAKLLSKLLEL